MGVRLLLEKVGRLDAGGHLSAAIVIVIVIVIAIIIIIIIIIV